MEFTKLSVYLQSCLREHSSVGLEHLPYKQRVGGSTPSAPTRSLAQYLRGFFVTQWGCFGFDSIRHWTVSTPGVVGLPVNLGLQTISWQQLLCTRCVVCKAHYLNPRRQGCVADEYPSALYAGYARNSGYHLNRMLEVTPFKLRQDSEDKP